MKTGSRRKADGQWWMAIAVVIPVILVAVVVGSLLFNQHAAGNIVKISGNFPAQPIPGTKVSLADAIDFVPYQVPQLPEVALSDPCTGQSSTLEMAAVWDQPQEDAADSQVGFNYGDGIWISVSPLSGFVKSIQEAGELPPADSFFPETDYPDGVTTGSVRGHRAWLKELDPKFTCSTADQNSVTSMGSESPSPGGPSDPEIDAVMFDPRQTANITWAENGVVVDLTGPYPVAELQKLAEQMEWIG
jgi:hypothetical protein